MQNSEDFMKASLGLHLLYKRIFKMKIQKGVSMIELLIVVAVVGILSAIAYPSYADHMLKSHRTQAMADMMKIQLTLEEKYNQSGSYDYTIVANGTCVFCETDTNRYKMTIDGSGTGANTYIVKATPQSATGQNKDECGTLNLNAAGIGSESGNSSCW